MRNYRFFIIVAYFFCATFNSFLNAQFQFDFKNTIKVDFSGELTNDAFSGGFNNPQFSTIDFDFDGDDDLFVFDRSSNHVKLYESVLENGQQRYRYVFNGNLYFPSDLSYRVALVDYDNDGKKDLFAATVGGTKVYRNVGNQIDGLQWQLVSPLLQSNYFNDVSNLYISNTDIPAYVDVDNDGDIDVLTYHISGQRVEYHQNQSVELYGVPDSLIFELKNECWGRFLEGAHSFAIQLSPDIAPCNGVTGVINPKSGITRHSGGSLLALDYDGNGVKDLIAGNISYRNLNLLINGGSAVNTDSPMISQDINFPSNSKRVNVLSFAASFWEDVDFDGVKDLIVAPNDKNNSSNKQSAWFYKNTGSNASPNFEFQSKDFLQKNTIDVGMGSVPIVVDVNQDGLSDLIVANYFEMNEDSVKKSSLHYFENQGTSTEPIFTLVDTNYLNVSTLNVGLRAIPTFGDITGDGWNDVVFGADNGKMYILKSNSSTTFLPIEQLMDNTAAFVTTEGGASPQLVDLNEDGLLDLVIGTKNGKIRYYENVGTNANYQFNLVSTNFGGVDVSENFVGYATPHFFKNDNEWFLFCGASNGKLHFYKNIIENGSFSSVFETISDAYLGINSRGYAAPFVADVDHNGKLNLFLGMELGGLWHFEHDPNSTLSITEELSDESSVLIYPNPSQGIFNLIISNSVDVNSVQLFDLKGDEVGLEINGNQIKIQNPVAGIFILKAMLKNNSQEINRKIVIE